MIEWIKKYIRVEFEIVRVNAERSVASITAALSKTVSDLEAHAADQVEAMKQKTLEAARLLKERQEHEEEHLKATKAAHNIKTLLG